MCAHTHIQNCGCTRTHSENGKGTDGEEVRGKENRKRENRDGDERLINPPFGGVL